MSFVCSLSNFLSCSWHAQEEAQAAFITIREKQAFVSHREDDQGCWGNFGMDEQTKSLDEQTLDMKHFSPSVPRRFFPSRFFRVAPLLGDARRIAENASGACGNSHPSVQSPHWCWRRGDLTDREPIFATCQEPNGLVVNIFGERGTHQTQTPTNHYQKACQGDPKSETEVTS